MPTIQGGQGTEKFVCATDDDRMYTLTDVPIDFFDEDPSSSSGSIRISVLKSCVDDSGYINMTAGDAIMVDSNVASLSANTKSVRTLIVMRVIDSRGLEPTHTKAEFANKIFGIGGDYLNLVSFLPLVSCTSFVKIHINLSN